VTSADILITRELQSLQIQIRGTQDRIDIENFFTDETAVTTNNSIERIQFSDGSYWDTAAIITRLQNNNSNVTTIGADVISGTINGDVIDALDGNDLISGDAGNDTLIGNAGNDLLLEVWEMIF